MKTDQEMLESLKKRQKIYIRERNRKLRIYGTVAGCFLAAVVMINTVPLFMKKSEMAPDAMNNEFEMRIESITNHSPVSQNSEGKSAHDSVDYQVSDVKDGALYSFALDGDFVCFLSPEGYPEVYEMLRIRTGTVVQTEENVVFTVGPESYFVRWHDDAGYCGLYGKNTTKENFTAVYHKLTQD